MIYTIMMRVMIKNRDHLSTLHLKGDKPILSYVLINSGSIIGKNKFDIILKTIVKPTFPPMNQQSGETVLVISLGY